MTQAPHNDVKQVTQLIISELLKNFNNSAESIRSINTVADLFIQSVLTYNLFKENKFFTREIQIISEEEFANSLATIKEGDPESVKCFTDYISHAEAKKFEFEVPYEYITDYVYSYEILIEYIVVEDRLNLLAQCIESKIIDHDANDIRTLEKVFRKFRRHLLLAIYQKTYIDRVTKKEAKNASIIASNAQSLANTASQLSNDAKINSEKAEGLALKAEGLAEKAEVLANEADAQAKSTIANYIAILGIFASIIFTLFGGVNVISATVKLLEANSRWPYLTFIIALLMICLLTLLNMLIKWITSINNLKNELERNDKTIKPAIHTSLTFWQKLSNLDFYTKSVILFGVVLLISLIGMYKVNKENNFSFSTETTTKNLLIADAAPAKEGNTANTAKKSPNIEKTVVEKIIVSKGNSQELARQED